MHRRGLPGLLGDELYRDLVARAEAQIATRPRTRPAKVKDAVVRARGFKVLRTEAEEFVEFDYRPTKCKRDYRVVALRKNLSVARGDNVLLSEYRYFFYITNDWELFGDEVVGEARDRCNQENLIAQLKALRAMHAPVNTLNANWAYMTMASSAPARSDGGYRLGTRGSVRSSACSTGSDARKHPRPTKLGVPLGEALPRGGFSIGP